jgi:glyceraldehyde 3-phosphate dehydrogenase
VPTATVSVVDLVVDLKKSASVEDLNNAFKQAAEGKMVAQGRE